MSRNPKVIELKNISFIGLETADAEAKKNGPYARYNVEFAITWQGVTYAINIGVGTREGWAAAAQLACLEVKAMGNFLAAEAGHLGKGPHVPGTMD